MAAIPHQDTASAGSHPGFCHDPFGEGFGRPLLPLRAVGAVHPRKNLYSDPFFILPETVGPFFFSGKRLCVSAPPTAKGTAGPESWCIISALLDSGGSRGSFSVCGPPGCHALPEDRGPGLAHRWGHGAKPDRAAPQGGWDSQWVTRPGLASSPLALGQVCQEGPRTRTSVSPVCGQTGRSEGTQGLSHSMATSCTPTVGRFVGSLGAEQPPPLCGNSVPRATRVLDFIVPLALFPRPSSAPPPCEVSPRLWAALARNRCFSQVLWMALLPLVLLFIGSQKPVSEETSEVIHSAST